MFLPSLPGSLTARPLVGLDLALPTAHLLTGRPRSRSWCVEVCSSRDLPSACLQDGRIVQFEALAELVRAWLTEAGLGPSPRVAMALSGPLLRRQRLPAPADWRPWRWRPWLQAQAERLAQAPLHEVAWSVQVLPGRPVQLWLCACPLAWVEDWQGLAEAAGLSLVRLDDRERVLHQAEGMGADWFSGLRWAEGLAPLQTEDFAVALGLARA